MVLHRHPRRLELFLFGGKQPEGRLVAGSCGDVRLFSQVRGLTMSSSKPNGIVCESVHEIQRDHSACRDARVCRTAPRIPQLTHRTFLLSLYRSTSNSSYIAIRGGLGDRLAEGVRQKGIGLSLSPQPGVHNEDSRFNVRVKQGHAHRVGLQPAANPFATATHHGETDDCDC